MTTRELTNGLNLKGIQKSFGNMLVLKGVDAVFPPGEVTALLGNNGAGKSTLAKIVTGALHADKGEMQLFGMPYAPHNVRSAMDAGVVAIYQEYSLIPDWAVWEHFARYHSGILARKRSGRKLAAEMFGLLGVEIDPNRRVNSLNALDLQTIEIAKAMASHARVLVVDEPTSGLDAATRLSVYQTLRRTALNGCIVIVISHDINSVLEFSDRVILLSGGCAAAPQDARLSNARDLFGLAPVHGKCLTTTDAGANGALMISAYDKSGAVIIKDWKVARGKVVGIASHPASSGHDLLRSMAGLSDRVETEVFLDAERVPSRLHERFRAGMAYVSRERSTEWLFEELSVAENLNMASMRILANGLIRNFAAESKNADLLVMRFGISAPSLTSVVTVLSGGNRQKAVVARAISAEPQMLLLDEPFSGVDVTTRHLMIESLHDFASKRRWVFIYSREIDELCASAHEVLLIRLPPSQAFSLVGNEVTQANVDRLLYGAN